MQFCSKLCVYYQANNYKGKNHQTVTTTHTTTHTFLLIFKIVNKLQ